MTNRRRLQLVASWAWLRPVVLLVVCVDVQSEVQVEAGDVMRRVWRRGEDMCVSDERGDQ